MKNILAATAIALLTLSTPAFAAPAWIGAWAGPAGEDWGGPVTISPKGIDMTEAGYTFKKLVQKPDGSAVARATFSEAGDCQFVGPCNIPTHTVIMTPKGDKLVIDFGDGSGPRTFTHWTETAN